MLPAICHHGYRDLITIYVLMAVLHIGTSSLRLHTTTPQVVVFRGVDVAVLECRYVDPNDDSVLSFNWYRKTVYDNDYKLIAQIPNRRSPVIVDLNLLKTTTLTYNRTENTAIVRLVIFNIQCLDEAKYQCETQLYGRATPRRPDMTLTVYERPSVPRIVQSPPVLKDNGNARFSCRGYMGKPQGQMRWVMVRKVRGRAREVELAGISSVTSMASYCKVGGALENSLQLSVSRFDLTLKCMVIQQSVQGYKPVTLKSVKLLDVRFSVRNVLASTTINGRQLPRTKAVSAVEGDTVVFTCSSLGNPAPKYKWRYVAPSGTNIGALSLSKESNQPRLTLANITANHSGSYICVSNNFVEYRDFSQTTVLKLAVSDRRRYETSSSLTTLWKTKRVTFPRSVVHYIMIGGIVASCCIFVLFLSLFFAHCSRKVSSPSPPRTYQGVPVRGV